MTTAVVLVLLAAGIGATLWGVTVIAWICWPRGNDWEEW